MSISEVIMKGSFSKDQNGKNIFYPFGAWGRGYVLATDAQFLKLRRRVFLVTIVYGIALIIIYSLTIGAMKFGLLIVLVLNYFATRYMFARPLEVSNVKYPSSEIRLKRWRDLSRPWLIILLAISVLFFIVGVWSGIKGSVLIALLFIFVFGYAIFIFWNSINAQK